MSTRPIGVYDSGVGGLTVLRILKEQLPNENFVYFADTAHLPYGNKSPKQIKSYAHDILEWMKNVADVKMVVAACHTSSAIAIPSISSPLPIVDAITPLLSVTPDNGIGIIATPTAAASRMHEQIFRQHGFTGPIITIDCPDFVPLIESGLETGQFDHEKLKKCTQEYLEPFYTNQLNTLIYGCTHYPFIRSIIESCLPENIYCIDPAETITKKTVDTLQNLHLLNTSGLDSSTTFTCNLDQSIFEKKLMNVSIT